MNSIEQSKAHLQHFVVAGLVCHTSAFSFTLWKLVCICFHVIICKNLIVSYRICCFWAGWTPSHIFFKGFDHKAPTYFVEHHLFFSSPLLVVDVLLFVVRINHLQNYFRGVILYYLWNTMFIKNLAIIKAIFVSSEKVLENVFQNLFPKLFCRIFYLLLPRYWQY